MDFCERKAKELSVFKLVIFYSTIGYHLSNICNPISLFQLHSYENSIIPYRETHIIEILTDHAKMINALPLEYI